MGPTTLTENKAEAKRKAKMSSEVKRVRIKTQDPPDPQRPNQLCPALADLPRVYHKTCCTANQQRAMLQDSHQQEKLVHRQAKVAPWMKHPSLHRGLEHPGTPAAFGRPRQMLTPRLERLPSPTS